MIAATVTLTTAGQDLFTLINAATSQLSSVAQNTGRVCEVQIQALTGTFHLVYKPGVVNLATDSGFLFQDMATDTTGAHNRMVMRAPSHNQLCLKDIYLAGLAGAETARITAFAI